MFPCCMTLFFVKNRLNVNAIHLCNGIEEHFWFIFSFDINSNEIAINLMTNFHDKVHNSFELALMHMTFDVILMNWRFICSDWYCNSYVKYRYVLNKAFILRYFLPSEGFERILNRNCKEISLFFSYIVRVYYRVFAQCRM